MRESAKKRADRFILSLVDPDAPPYGSASLFEFGYGLRPTLWMTRGSFGKTTIVERAGLVVPDRYRELLLSAY